MPLLTLLNRAKLSFLTVSLFASQLAFGQSPIDSIFDKLDAEKWTSVVQSKVTRLEKKIIEKTLRTLRRMQEYETRAYSRLLNTKDSLVAKEKLAEIGEKYSAVTNNLKNSSIKTAVTQYLPSLDTLTSALRFLTDNGVTGKVKEALSKATSLQERFERAGMIRQFISERKRQLTGYLEGVGFVREIKNINKEVFYYSQQIKQYREILKDPRKIERRAIELLSKTKAFRDFMRKNSLLASLFRVPGDLNDPDFQSSLSGLQTRVQVNALIDQQLTAGGASGVSQFQQNVQAAQAQLNLVKARFARAGVGSSDDIMPEGFKPNTEKTKSFLDRIELGTNIQTQSARSYFPVTSDVAVSIGYKLNGKSMVGVGASYKLGWGTGWTNIRITHEGFGLRSFIDWKLKGSFWVSGGYEMNYRTAFERIEQLRNLDAWQRSGLLGISKSVPIKTKLFKNTKLQLLWDFLSYDQMPRTPPIVFRIGYNFN